MNKFNDAAEAAFAADMLRYFREAGEREAWRLLARLVSASEDGATRQDLTLVAQCAAEGLATRH